MSFNKQTLIKEEFKRHENSDSRSCMEMNVDGCHAIAMCLKNFKNSDRFHDKDVKVVSVSLLRSFFFIRLSFVKHQVLSIDGKWNFVVICQVCRAIAHRCLKLNI